MKKTGFYLGLALLSFIVFIGCSDNDSDSDYGTTDNTYKEILTNEAAVITATYVDLAEKAKVLKDKVYALEKGNDAALQAAKEAWVVARAPWELSEAFLWGPVDFEGVDPAIDSWPVNVAEIDAIFASGKPITPEVLEANDETRGFHTLEYYLWGVNGNKKASELTDREIEYLKAVAQDLYEKTTYLADKWSPSGGNYSSVLINAGQNDVYKSPEAALTELVEGMITIADEVASQKIETPLNGNNGSAKPDEEESRFSKNSILDFSDNIRSIQNIYLGKYKTAQGKGLTDIVAPQNPLLDAQIKAKITESINALEAIPVSFTDAIFNNRSKVENAQNKILELQDILENQLKKHISNL
ncbi:MAG: imelysin [Flavobacteriaceae bacterium]|jgi:uncharacterized iron-regulated protein|nr:imelysin [Flavobacteriaceae bacterium]